MFEACLQSIHGKIGETVESLRSNLKRTDGLDSSFIHSYRRCTGHLYGRSYWYFIQAFIAGMSVSINQTSRQDMNLDVGVIMIVTTTRITVSSANRTELFQTISTLLPPLKSENGCLSSHFYLDSEDTNSGLLVEEWEAEEDWETHLRSDDCAIFLGAIRVLCRPASVDFKVLSYVAGIEAITAARSAGTIDNSELYIELPCSKPLRIASESGGYPQT